MINCLLFEEGGGWILAARLGNRKIPGRHTPPPNGRDGKEGGDCWIGRGDVLFVIRGVGSFPCWKKAKHHGKKEGIKHIANVFASSSFFLAISTPPPPSPRPSTPRPRPCPPSAASSPATPSSPASWARPPSPPRTRRPSSPS